MNTYIYVTSWVVKPVFGISASFFSPPFQHMPSPVRSAAGVNVWLQELIKHCCEFTSKMVVFEASSDVSMLLLTEAEITGHKN